MMKQKMIYAVVAVFLAVQSAQADLTVMDFESLASPGNGENSHGSTYTEAGFTVTASTSFLTPYFNSRQTGSQHYAGSTGLYHTLGDGTITLTQNSGDEFDMFSIDLAKHSYNKINDSTTVTFTGHFSGSSDEVQSFDLTNGILDFETFFFDNRFQNLESLTWVQSSSYHQFDNITTGVVPVPGAALLGFIGMATSGHFLRRRRKA